MPDGSPAMVDQIFLDYVRSTAPAPTQRALDELLAPVTRVRVLSAGMLDGKAMQGPLLFEASAPEQLAALRARLAIVEDPKRFGHCMCLGSPTIELYEGAKLRAAIGLHHGLLIRWDGWKHDAPLADSLALLRWMASLGAGGPLRDFEEARAEDERAAARWGNWMRAMPTSLSPFRSALEQYAQQGSAPLDLDAMLRALSAQVPEESERARALFAWLGQGAGLWSGFPAYEQVPEKLLSALDTCALLAAIEGRALTAEEAEGAARYFGGRGRRKKPGQASEMSPALRRLLLEVGSKTTDADRLARAQAAFGEG